MSYLVLDPLPRCRDKLVCCGCMAKEGKMFDLLETNLVQAFNELTGLQIVTGQLCYICLQLLRKCQEFRIQCLKTNYMMRQIHTISGEGLNQIDNSDLRPTFAKPDTLSVNYDPTLKGKRSPMKPKLTRTDIVNVDIFADNQNSNSKEDEPNINLTEYFDINSLEFHHVSIKNCVNDDDGFGWPNEDGHDEKKDEISVLPCEIMKEATKGTEVVESNKNVKKPKLRKRRIKAEIVSEDDDYDDLDPSYKSDDSDSAEPRKKRKYTKRKPPKERVRKSTRNLEGLSEDHIIILDIAQTYLHIWRTTTKNKDDIFRVFERMYELSLIKNPNEISMQDLTKNEKLERQTILNFLDLHIKVSEIYNIDFEFDSLIKQRHEMNEKRKLGDLADSCKQCCRKYNSPDTYERHMNRSHNEKSPYKCEICFYRFRKQRLLRMHLLRKHATRMKCRECNLSIGSGDHVNYWARAREHQQLHRGIKPACTYCGKTFNERKLLTMHIRSMHRAEINAIDCLLCGDTYNGQQGLTVHMNSIHKEAIQCDTCSVWFLNREVFEAHAQNRCNTNESACPLCGAGFPSEDSMKEHLSEQHALYKCKRCQKTFPQLKTYKEHYYQLCSQPQPRQRLPKNYRDDAVVAVKKRKKQVLKKDKICEICGKCFNCLANLKTHQMIHTGERPYKCEHCDRRFRLQLTLRVHLATHTGERPYKCTLCPAAFRQYPHLKAHMPLHTKEKNHECEVCLKRFTQRANMQEHVRTVHEGKPSRNGRKRNKKHIAAF